MHFTQPGGSFSSLDSNNDGIGDGDGDDNDVDVADGMEWTAGVDDDDDDDDDDRDGMPGIGWTFPCISCGLGLVGFKIEGYLSPLDGTTIGVNP